MFQVVSRFLCVGVICVTSSLSLAAAKWEVVDDKDGIQVSRIKIEGSDIFGFKGSTVIDAPIGKVFDVLVDKERRPEWVDRLKINKQLEKKSAFESIIYQSFDLPWPISDRDYIYRAKIFRKSPNTVLITMSSIDYKKGPKTVGVRAHLQQSRYSLSAMPGGKTAVEVEIHTDPKGRLPTWLVNLIQKSWPLKTLSGIRSQVKKPFVKSRALPTMAH